MEQKKFDDGKTFWEMQCQRNPTVWEVGIKYDPESNSCIEVNGKPDFRRTKNSKFKNN